MKITDSEKLILFMLSTICKKLDIHDEIDPEFVMKVICNDKTWALKWKYSGLFHGSEGDTPSAVIEVLDILSMWDSIEAGYELLTASEKESLKEAAKLPRKVEFGGFDGNNETEHYGIAKCLIDDLGRFSNFQGRDLNTHYQVLDGYKRMLMEFQRLGAKP